MFPRLEDARGDIPFAEADSQLKTIITRKVFVAYTHRRRSGFSASDGEVYTDKPGFMVNFADPPVFKLEVNHLQLVVVKITRQLFSPHTPGRNVVVDKRACFRRLFRGSTQCYLHPLLSPVSANEKWARMRASGNFVWETVLSFPFSKIETLHIFLSIKKQIINYIRYLLMQISYKLLFYINCYKQRLIRKIKITKFAHFRCVHMFLFCASFL